MKKLFSLLLCLVLFLPVMAMAENQIETDVFTIDFGDFTMVLHDGDYYEIASTKTSNAVYAMVYPAYDATAVTHDNFNVVWSAEDASPVISLYGAETFAKLMIQTYEAQYKTMGIKMTDAQVIAAKYEDGVGAFVTSCFMDYTDTGYELVTPMYQLQAYFCFAEQGTYIFTFSSVSFDELETLSSYLDTVVFK
ncbi:MAG: hypothetical protein ACI4ME_05260 [Aristaeellaceae bacterium]